MIGHGRNHRANLVLFLIFVVILQFGYPITLYGRGWTILYSLTYLGVVLFGIALAGTRRHTRTALLATGLAAIAVALWFASDPPTGRLEVARPLVVGAFQVALLVPLGRYILGGGPSEDRADVLLVSLNTYLLIGAVFASAFQAIGALDPAAFVDHNTGTVTWQTLSYASYTTLTTLGFGDVVATNPWARSLMTLEAVVGPLFIATVIARLIGSHGGDAVARLVDDAPQGR